MTLEQIQLQEESRIAFQKNKAENAITKLTNRLNVENTDEKERLNMIISNHQSFKESLETLNVSEISMEKFTNFQSKLPKNELINPIINN